MEDKAEIKYRDEILEIQDKIIGWRRHIHQYPELKYEEVETAKYIVNVLKELGGFEIHEGVGRTGVVAILRGTASQDTQSEEKGDSKQKCILIRADMDALPLKEQTGEEFSSKKEGVHHACGHDGHVAMALAAAWVARKWQSRLKGIIKFVFQPAEEGGAGALAMINDAKYPVLENPTVDKCFAIHLSNSCLQGKIFVTEGPITGSSDRFSITIKGKGSHAFCPHDGVDAVMIGCLLVTQLYTITARSIDPMNPFTLSVGSIQGGTAPNIISETCTIQGTFRTVYPEDRKVAIKRLEEITKGFEQLHNCKIQYDFIKGYDIVINHPDATNDIIQSLKNLGYPPQKASFGLAAEDFCYFAERKPSNLFLVTSAPKGSVLNNGKTILKPHHSPFFTIDEQSLLHGASVWVQLIEDQLIK